MRFWSRVIRKTRAPAFAPDQGSFYSYPGVSCLEISVLKESDLQRVLRQIELEVLKETNDLNAPRALAAHANHETDFFRLLPKEEKEAFMKSFGAKGRQLLAELEKTIDDSPDLFDLPSA
jgi:hypothetical protein